MSGFMLDNLTKLKEEHSMDRTVKRVLLYCALAAGAFLTFRLLDLLMAWSIYSWFFENIQNMAGLPDTLNGALSIWLAVITMLLIPTFLSALFFRRTTKKMVAIASAVSGWLVLSYFLAQPKEGQLFNPMTGQAMYRYYKGGDGKIELLPLGYKYHPRYGTLLLPLTPETIQELDRQKTREAEEQKIRSLQQQKDEAKQRAKELARQKAEQETKNRELAELQAGEQSKILEMEQQKTKELDQLKRELEQRNKEETPQKTQRILNSPFTPSRAQDTGLVIKDHVVLSDNPESYINLAELDFSYRPIQADEGWIDSTVLMERAEKAKAIGSLGLAKLVLDAEREGKNIIP